MIPVRDRRPSLPARAPCGRRGGILKHLLIPLAVAVALLTLAWMLLLPALFAQKLEQATGHRLAPGRLMANPVSGHLRMTDATLFGPPGLPRADFLEIARLETTARPWHLRQRPLQLPRLALDITTLHIVIGPGGVTNLDAWDAALATFSADGRAPLRIESLELHVGRVIVADYSRGDTPRLAEFTPGYRRTHTGVTAWAPVWRDVLAAARR
ncbi:MAG: hypothetical protein ABII82_05025 [Verrucomicrobiota bacterium]